MKYSIEQKFKRAIKSGTGEAILLLKENTDFNFDPLIIEACTNNLAYDPQCEGTRANYLYEIITLANNRNLIEKEIVKQLIEAKSDFWNTLLLFELGEFLVKNGSVHLKTALYERYLINLNPEFEFVETEVLVNLDGFKGLEFCADVQGQRIKADPDYWADGSLLELIENNYPPNNPYEFLYEKAKENDFIKAYLDQLNEIENLRKKNKPKKKESYQIVSKMINEKKDIPIIVGKCLTKEDLIKIANDLLHEKVETKIELYLRIFSDSKLKYPLEAKTILPFLKFTSKKIKHFALRILSKIEDKEIRKILESRYHDLNFINNNLELFTSNFLSKDIELFCKILEMQEDEDSIHWFMGIIIKIFENNEIQQPSKLLNQLYKIGNCSICRKSIVKILIYHNDLSEQILAELKYDCESEIRELVQ